MILITGATGGIGQEMIKLLQDKDVPFRAMVGDTERATALRESGVDVVMGDFDQPESLVTAVLDIERLFLLSPAAPDMVSKQTSLIDAACRAGVQHIVKLSGLDAATDAPTRFGQLHAQIEQKIEKSGLTYTHLRPHYFMQNFLMFAPTISTEGAFYAPMKDGKIGIVDARDIAAVAAAVLTEDGHADQTYDITGPEALSFFSMAEILSAVRKRRVTYVDIPADKARAGMLHAGTPEWLADAILELYEVFGEGSAEIVTDTVENITGQRARGFEEFAVDYADHFAKRRTSRHHNNREQVENGPTS